MPDISSTGWHTKMPAHSDSEFEAKSAKMAQLDTYVHAGYSVSKIGVNRLTLLLSKRLETDARTGILINCVSL